MKKLNFLDTGSFDVFLYMGYVLLKQKDVDRKQLRGHSILIKHLTRSLAKTNTRNNKWL